MAQASHPSIRRKPITTQQDRETPSMPEPSHYPHASDRNFDGAANNASPTQNMHPKAPHTPSTNALGSYDGDHQRVTFRADSPFSLPSMPQVMIRRGVPRAMFDADIAQLNALYDTRKRKDRDDLCLMLLTCGLWGDAIDVYNRDVRSYVMEMDRRYQGYSVTWSMEFVPMGGTFVTYET